MDDSSVGKPLVQRIMNEASWHCGNEGLPELCYGPLPGRTHTEVHAPGAIINFENMFYMRKLIREAGVDWEVFAKKQLQPETVTGHIL